MKRYVKISSEKQSNISSHRIRCCKIRKFFYLTFRYDYEVTFGLWKVFIYLDSNKYKRRKDTRRIWKSNATYLRIHRIRNSSTLWYIIIMTLHSIFAKYSFILMFIISTSDERVYEGYKSNAIYRIRRCKIRKFFYITFILIRLRYCTRPLRSTHFFISIILITTNERIYIKNLEFINFDIFASKEILRYEISIHLVFTKYILSR